MALSFPFDREIVIFFMDTVWFSVFPLILFSVLRDTSLMLMVFPGVHLAFSSHIWLRMGEPMETAPTSV